MRIHIGKEDSELALQYAKSPHSISIFIFHEPRRQCIQALETQ